MPTICIQDRWKIFTNPKENFEKFHVHATKADKDCKFYLTRVPRKIEVDKRNNMTSKEIKKVEQIIDEHFEECWRSWHETQKDRGTIGYSS